MNRGASLCVYGERAFHFIGLMMKTELTCPKCGAIVEKYLNPKPTVDIVIHDRERGLVLVDRKNPAYEGDALPGGFMHLGKSAEQAAVREAFEETNLRVKLTRVARRVFRTRPQSPPAHHLHRVYRRTLEPRTAPRRGRRREGRFLFDGSPAPPSFSITPKSLPISRASCTAAAPPPGSRRLRRRETIGEGRGNPSPGGGPSPLPRPPPLSLLRLSRLSNPCCRLFLSADKKP